MIALGIANGLLLVLLLYLGVCAKAKFLYLLAFLMPLQGIAIQAGILWAWPKVVFGVALLTAAIRRGALRGTRGAMPRSYWALWLYAVVITVAYWIADVSDGHYYAVAKSLGWGVGQVELRYPIQLISHVSTWGVALVGPWFVRETAHRDAVLRGYVAGAVVSVVVGVYQVVALTVGLPWPTWEASPFLSSGAVERARSTTLLVPRLIGLGGEPKHTASFTAVALVAVIAGWGVRQQGDFRGQRGSAWVAGILVLALVLTGSTGGLVCLLALLVGFLLVSAGRGGAAALRKAAPLAVFLALGATLAGSEILGAFLETRVLSRLSAGYASASRFEPKDAALVDYALESPSALLLGHGAGGVDFRLIEHTDPLFLTYGGTVTPAYLLPRMVGDFGLPGVGLLVAMMAAWYQRMGKGSFGRRLILLGGIAAALTNAVAFGALLLLIGTEVAWWRERREKSAACNGLARSHPAR